MESKQAGGGKRSGAARGGRVRALATPDLAALDRLPDPSLNELCAIDMLTRTFAATVDVFRAAVFVTDIEGLVLHLNPAAVRISGSSPDLARGRHIADLLYTPLNAELRDQHGLLETARRQGHATVRLAIPITTYRGEMQLIDYHAIPLTDDAGELIGGLFIASDFRHAESISETG